LRRQEAHRAAGLFVAEGEKVVRRLLASDLQVVSVMLPPKWQAEYEGLLRQRGRPVRLFVAEKALLETLTGFSMYQGLMSVGRVPEPPGLDTLFERSAAPRLWVAVDGLSNAQNLGSLVRNCVAFGVQGLLVGETSASPYLRRAVRASMGTLFQLPVLECTDLVRMLAALRRYGVRCVAAHPHAGGKALMDSELRGDCCVVLGSEGEGLRPTVLEACDEWVAIPMASGVDSLNVAVAAAVFLYEACRQRRPY
jgi:tRNA G18 (ribose-2'-O)-methylase SpoU